MAAAKTTTLEEALIAAQREAPALQKNAINPHFKNKYINLDSLMEQVLPVLNKHDLLLEQHPSHLGESPALRTRLTHVKTGDFVEDTMPLILDKDNSQGQGSAITYARRYSLMAVLGLVADEDDDANAASPKARARPARKQTKTVEETTESDGIDF